MCFTLRAQISPDQPHVKCSVAGILESPDVEGLCDFNVYMDVTTTSLLGNCFIRHPPQEEDKCMVLLGMRLFNGVSGIENPVTK